MQEPLVKVKFCPIYHPYIATPPLVHATCRALAIRLGLHFTKLAIDFYLALFLATPFCACMQIVNSVVLMPLCSYLHHLLA